MKLLLLILLAFPAVADRSASTEVRYYQNDSPGEITAWAENAETIDLQVARLRVEVSWLKLQVSALEAKAAEPERPVTNRERFKTWDDIAIAAWTLHRRCGWTIAEVRKLFQYGDRIWHYDRKEWIDGWPSNRFAEFERAGTPPIKHPFARCEK